ISARNRDVEGEGRGPADDGTVRPRGVHTLERDLVEEALHALLGGSHPEVLADRENRGCELVEIFDRANVESRQKSSGQYGGRGVRNRASARASAPSFSSRTRSAAASRLKSKAPRYTQARSDTSSSSSAGSSVRRASPPIRQRPAFHRQNSSLSSTTTPSSVAYDRPRSAASTSTSRSQSPSDARSCRLRASTTIRNSGEAGSSRLSTRMVRSIPKRKRHSSRSAA